RRQVLVLVLLASHALCDAHSVSSSCCGGRPSRACRLFREAEEALYQSHMGKREAEETLYQSHLGKREAEETLYQSRLGKREAEETLYQSRLGKREAEETLYQSRLGKREAEETLYQSRLGKREAEETLYQSRLLQLLRGGARNQAAGILTMDGGSSIAERGEPEGEQREQAEENRRTRRGPHRAEGCPSDSHLSELNTLSITPSSLRHDNQQLQLHGKSLRASAVATRTEASFRRFLCGPLQE
ncbi:hypothetical protein NHX12_032586, partial [Muraenolepis orangiensis]